MSQSADFDCQSPIHNTNSSTIFVNNINAVNQNVHGTYSEFKNLIDRVAIKSGTIVNIFATRCDGIEECFGGIDEVNCGFDPVISVLIGKLLSKSICVVGATFELYPLKFQN